MATGIIKTVNAIEALTVTRINNSYFNEQNIGRLHAYKKNGILTLKFNLFVSTATPVMTDFMPIAQITGWHAVEEVLASLSGQTSTNYAMGVRITADGEISITTPSQVPVGTGFRSQITTISV